MIYLKKTRKLQLELLVIIFKFKISKNQCGTQHHSFQNRIGPGGRIVKTGNRDEYRVFKPKEPDFLLIP